MNLKFNTKPVKIFSLIFGSMLVWFLLSITDNSVINKPSFPQLTDQSSGQATCADTKTGWACEFDPISGDSDQWDLSILDAYAHECESMGGQWACYGRCLPYSTHDCHFKFQDGGDLCISNLQCGGKCVGTIGIGKCSDFYVSSCDGYTEIFFGIPIRHMAFCD